MREGKDTGMLDGKKREVDKKEGVSEEEKCRSDESVEKFLKNVIKNGPF